MLEIILLWLLGKNIAAKAKAKGHAPTGYVVLLVLLWVVGELGGIFVGATIAAMKDPELQNDSDVLHVLGGALFGILIGAATAFLIVGSLPDRKMNMSDWEEDDFERERRRENRRHSDDKWDTGDRWEKDERFER